MKLKFQTLILALTILGSACATNLPMHGVPANFSNNNSTPLEDLAILTQVGDVWPNLAVYALVVDGKKIRNLRWANNDSIHGPPYVFLDPGKHQLELHVTGAAEIANLDLEVEFVSGHTYVPRGRRKSVNSNVVEIWLEDKGKNFPKNCLPTAALEQHGNVNYFELNGCP